MTIFASRFGFPYLPPLFGLISGASEPRERRLTTLPDSYTRQTGACYGARHSTLVEIGNKDWQIMPTSPGKESVSAPSASTARSREELPYRLRQQSLLGEFGRSALQTRDITQILQRATELCAQGLDAPFAKALEYMPDENRLLVRAGVGWAPETIGNVSLGIDMESPSGYAFHTGQIVISNHLQEETRFRTPSLLADHGVNRA